VHEVSIVQSLIQQVEAEVRQAGCDGRILRLGLVIGRLSGVHADSVRFAFEMLGPGTLLEGAELHITEPSAELVCKDCGARTPIEDLTAECPACGSRAVVIEGGRDLLLESIEVEDSS